SAAETLSWNDPGRHRVEPPRRPAVAVGGAHVRSGDASIGEIMGLTMGTGPFGKKPAGTFNFQPDPPKGHALYLEPSPRRVRGVLLGRRRALVRGGRGGLRPPARPLPPRRPDPELAQRAHLAGRRRAGRVEPPAGLLRDQPADALVPAQGRPRRGVRGDDSGH